MKWRISVASYRRCDVMATTTQRNDENFKANEWKEWIIEFNLNASIYTSIIFEIYRIELAISDYVGIQEKLLITHSRLA